MQPKWLTVVVILSVLFSVLNSAFSTTKAAPDAVSWQLTGQAGGPTQGIAVQDNYAYIGVGPRLEVMDISNPAAPHPMGASAPFSYTVQGLAVSGVYAYVATGPTGLQIEDVSTPSSPARKITVTGV